VHDNFAHYQWRWATCYPECGRMKRVHDGVNVRFRLVDRKMEQGIGGRHTIGIDRIEVVVAGGELVRGHLRVGRDGVMSNA